jgi:hypothetical protein
MNSLYDNSSEYEKYSGCKAGTNSGELCSQEFDIPRPQCPTGLKSAINKARKVYAATGVWSLRSIPDTKQENFVCGSLPKQSSPEFVPALHPEYFPTSRDDDSKEEYRGNYLNSPRPPSPTKAAQEAYSICIETGEIQFRQEPHKGNVSAKEYDSDYDDEECRPHCPPELKRAIHKTYDVYVETGVWKLPSIYGKR